MFGEKFWKSNGLGGLLTWKTVWEVKHSNSPKGFKGLIMPRDKASGLKAALPLS